MKQLKYISFILIFSVVIFTSILESKQQKQNFKIGVNKFAWNAALQTINFMPISSADPFSGIIITEWYGINDKEEFKLNIYILQEKLTSETIQVKVFSRQKQADGSWKPKQISKEMSTKIEDSILNLARKLRIETVLNK